MAIQEQPSLAQRVYTVMDGLAGVHALRPVVPETDLKSIGFDSLACAELAAVVQDELGIDVVDSQMAGLQKASEVADLVERTGARERPRRDPYPRGMGRMQRTAVVVIGWPCRWWFDLDIVGTEHMPRSGPVVLCSNHESLLDIPLTVVAAPRPIRFMAKRELFAKPRMARFFHELGGFPVDRDAFDLRAIETALGVVRRGEVLGMYPEATRMAGELLPFLPGAAWIALKTGAPLLPAAIRGTGDAMPSGARFFKRVPIRIEFAPPIPVERVDDPVERRKRSVGVTEQLRGTIELMWKR